MNGRCMASGCDAMLSAGTGCCVMRHRGPLTGTGGCRVLRMLRLLATSKILPHLSLQITSIGLFLQRSSSVVVVMLSFILAMALIGHSLLGAPAGSSRSE